jgi:nucleoside-diphosphate-sugar epimerase
MNFLVTGANGFIGKYFVNYISTHPNSNIIAVDKNFNAETSIYQLENGSKITELSLDLTGVTHFEKLKSYKIDYIYHFAAINGTQKFYSEPWDVFYNSSLPTINLIQFALKNWPKLMRFTYTSSSEVYADINSSESEKTNETVPVGFKNILNPRWSYGGAKLLGEIALNSASVQFGMPFTIIRYHNVYGPDMGINHVIPDFIKRGEVGNFELNGSNNVRSFVYISDAIQATYKIGSSTAAINKVVHVGNEEPISMKKLATLIMKACNWDGEIKLNDAPEGSTNYRCPDTSFLRNEIGFKSEIDLVSGLKMTCNWYLENSKSEGNLK